MQKSVKEQFFSAFKAFKKVHSNFMADTELTPGEFFMLSVIDKLAKEAGGEKSVYVNNISAKLQMTMPAVSQLLKILEHKGKLMRGVSASDRRKVTVELTDNGRQSLENSNAKANYLLDRIISEIGEDKIQSFLQLFTQITDVIEKCNNEKTFSSDLKKDEMI
ncbi:MAG TPA: hypothetical protein DCP97_01450 [Ruminococcaceae bacterium]|nr:hypothetical protein [Oscillospiraceae bacterium]